MCEHWRTRGVVTARSGGSGFSGRRLVRVCRLVDLPIDVTRVYPETLEKCEKSPADTYDLLGFQWQKTPCARLHAGLLRHTLSQELGLAVNGPRTGSWRPVVAPLLWGSCCDDRHFLQERVRMRLAVVIHEYPPVGGGAATAACKLAEDIVAQGHEVMVVTAAVRGCSSPESVNGVQLRRMWSLRRRWLSPKPYELLSFCASLSCRLTRHLRRFRPDGVLAFMAVPSGYFAVRSARKLRVPVVVSLQGSDVPGFSRRRLGGVYRLAALPLIRDTLRRADWIVPNSCYLKHLALSFLPEVEDKTQVIRNGIEPELVAETPAASQSGYLSIIQVGQLIARKRVDITIRAVAALHNDRIPVHLSVVGEGPMESELRRLSRELDADECVEFLGHLPRERIVRMLREHDVFVMTSAAEGMSNALLEAMASGLPVIIPENGSHDIVAEANCGRILRGDLQVELELALRRLADDRRECQRLGAAGIEFARRHTWRNSARSLLALFNYKSSDILNHEPETTNC